MLETDWSTASAAADALLADSGGVAHISAFLAAGFTRHQVAALFRRGALTRPRIGWYATPTLSRDAFRAIRIGGVLGCTSAARTYELPVPEAGTDLLEVSVHANASRLRHSTDRTWEVSAGDEAGVRLHWHPRLEPAVGFRVGVADVLLQLACCVPLEWLVAAMDAALHVPRGGTPLISPASWALLRPALPERLRRAVDLVDGGSESPIETLVRLGMLRAGISFAIQVWVLPFHRVDFLVDGWLVVEVDGRQYHDDPEAFERDRARDALLASWGFRVLRFSYTQVTEELPWVLEVIASVQRAGR